ncbi:MAG: prolyl oligopeptidase family serine peptidase [Verrucomicrobiales bacterium]|nr:prolyl oligopeptidase family serine peptidase [Verrucomicrobiales bacterium]
MMQRIQYRVLGAAMLVACLTSAAQSEPSTTMKPAPPQQLRERFTHREVTRHELGYLLSFPEGYDKSSKKKWPLLLFLHGAGERGTNLNKVAVHGPPKLIEKGTKLPFIVVSPQCPAGEIWDDATLLALLDKLSRKHRVDPKRIYLTGLSMGGYGSWSLATRHPERFAAVAPICGGGERIRLLLMSESQRKALKTLGIWAFHGAKDSVVPLEESERMIKAVKAAGNTAPKFTIYPETDHDSWTEAYNNPELFAWFLNYSR